MIVEHRHDRSSQTQVRLADASVAHQPGESMTGETLDVSVAVQFLTTLFQETDQILLRPIETWTDNGTKQTRVDVPNTSYPHATSSELSTRLKRLMAVAAEQYLNLFFGVCPRFGTDGKYDLAWQIRNVRCLWTDIDHVSIDEVHGRIAKSNLPSPSIIVNSGNGVHLYWLLDEPYQIDDVEDPPAVYTEWQSVAGGSKKSHKYIVENGEKVPLKQRSQTHRLSPKAVHVQNVLAGIAQLIQGDHTTDLSRLLRIPGTWNRKDERNGRSPLSTMLVKCDSTQRYSFDFFSRFAIPSPEAQRLEQIAKMPVRPLRTPSPGKREKLADYIIGCQIAKAGCRSETDFALCCFALEQGIDPELVWSEVEHHGKFAELGRRYFDLTWSNAKFRVQVAKLEQVESRILKSDSLSSGHIISTAFDEHHSGGTASHAGPGQKLTIQIDAANTPISDTLREITTVLLGTKECFLRCEQLVVVNGDTIQSILTPAELAGLLNQHVEFFYVDDRGGKYLPLTPAYANTLLNQRVERSRIPEIKLFTRNPVFTQDWRSIRPGYDSASGIFYAGPAIEPADGKTHLNELLEDFCFRTPADRTNYLAVLLTAILVPHFIGAKPAAMFNGNQPGLGKSILGQIIAIIRDGYPTETASYNSNDEEFEKRLGAIVHRGATTILIDNAKGHGRQSRIDSACLERSITDAVLSFRLLGKSQEIRAENSHIFCITANTPDVSPDLISRSVIINLYYDGDPKRRNFHVADPESYAQLHRHELLGELLGMIQRWNLAGRPLAEVSTRFNKRGWGSVIGGILELNDEPDFLANADEAASQLDDTRRDFEELLQVLADHPQGHWTPTELVELCTSKRMLVSQLGDGSPRSQVTKFGTLASRFIDETITLSDERKVIFRRPQCRKGFQYRVEVIESAEP